MRQRCRLPPGVPNIGSSDVRRFLLLLLCAVRLGWCPMQACKIGFALVVLVGAAGVFLYHTRVGPFAAVHGPETALTEQQSATLAKGASARGALLHGIILRTQV